MNTNEQAIGFAPGAPFSNGYVAGNTLYIAGQQGPDADGQVIAAVNVSTHAGRRTLNSIVEELLQPLLATARRIELDLARSRASARARPDA